MRAAIIGCGYVGTQVAQRWRQQGLTVTATTTSPERLDELTAVADRAVVLTGNQSDALQDCLADQQTALVCVGSKRQASYEDTYLQTAKNLAAVLPETSVQQLVYTSTYSVYGQHYGRWVTEATPVEPVTDKAKVLVAAEQLLLSAARPDLKVCLFRLGGIYGPGRELARIFSRSAGQTRPGRGETASNWVHLDDIVGAIDFARSQSLAGIYNLVQDEIPTVKALIDRVCARHGLAPVSWEPSQPSARPYNARVSNQKLKAAGYTFQRPTFESAL
ncbi:MAG: NAD-dependent epimerase/dehydratase family protein [Leptolyngbya sp. SIO4C1]|nr:NAD-dependent epimerase/dehydratase family protein [Leptolyngbya sp. SIO4C1]